ncbi:hypothetical protein MZM54_03515 [[Brevibacterium] frigoritolerans]|nr:hypothetical protein [Peribacillus frigoritolerans]
MDNERRVLNGPFDIEEHKKTFKNYLEVIILEDGTIVYAVPSHQEKLIAIACEKLGITRKQLSDLCPIEYYFDFMNWLCQITNCVSLWNERMEGIPNEEQIKSLKKLIEEKLYYGPIKKQGLYTRQ